jgi:hypothetical protein
VASKAIVVSNKYHAGCEFCEGLKCHEPWCIVESANVRYAYEIILNPELITFGDKCALHSMGVTYCAKKCTTSK